MASERQPRVELLQGTLDLIVLRALDTMGPLHAATRLGQVADHPLSLNQGTLYPALVRLEQKGWIKGTWQRTEHNRGFVKTANAGLALTTAPYVCVLNSDTLVTAGWLERLVRCAESDPAIMVVNPISNAAVFWPCSRSMFTELTSATG